MEILFVSTAVVALAEIGDKTQLLALVLALRYRAPLAISLGILGATTANHTLASLLGVVAADLLTPDVLRWILALSFIGMALWTLRPDRLDAQPGAGRGLGAFAATLIAFFLVEIGDKTQLATIALAARYHSVVAVTAGTTLGMMIANVPVVLAGQLMGKRVPLKLVRRVTALMFLALGVLALIYQP
jgi:putative Ca2+/H+ antiporter (TMEM165/GDT1 family)